MLTLYETSFEIESLHASFHKLLNSLYYPCISVCR